MSTEFTCLWRQKLKDRYQGPTKMPDRDPDWWCSKGTKMRVVEKERRNMLTGVGDLVINNGVIARVIINHLRRSRFLIDWGIAHAGTMDGPHTSGRIELSADELDQALGLNDVTKPDIRADWMFRKYGATVASPGKFLRWGRFLNIPGPGTGEIGDANVSIYVDDTICAATKALLRESGIA